MKIMAFDAAARRTGWAVLAIEDSPQLLDYGSIELPKSMGMGERLCLFQQAVRKLVKEYQPDRISIEETYVRFINSAKTLLKIAGAVEQIAYETTEMEAVIVPVATVRTQLGVKEKGEKAKIAIAALVKEKFHTIDVEYDETDAIAVGWVTPILIRRKECKRKRSKN